LAAKRAVEVAWVSKNAELESVIYAQDQKIAKLIKAYANLRLQKESMAAGYCHTRFLRPKPDAHRMYAKDQVVIQTVRM
jgi:Glu-tRNA(Gln) amidotransferase subunit E-like FAD-binding protein